MSIAPRSAATPDLAAEAAELRIAFISDAIPERNGVGAYYCDLVEQLDEYLHSAVLIGPESDYASRLSMALPGDSTQRVYFPRPRQTMRRLEGLAPQVVVVATPGPFGLYGLRAARRLGATVMVAFHTHFEKVAALYPGRVFNSLTRVYLNILNRKLFDAGYLVVANTDDMVDAAREMGAAQVELIGTPIASCFLDPAPSEIGSDKLSKVLYAGRLAPEKNLDAILTAAAELPQIAFRVAGDGPLRRDVLAAAERLSNLEYMGWLDRHALRDALDDADLLLLPSHVESFGTVAIEAMARRRPVLVAAGCGILAWSSLAQGLFCMQHDEALHDALRRVGQLDPAIRQRVAQRGLEAARSLNDDTVGHWLNALLRCARVSSVC
jgi:glycosyltransferase involved in cell wall biosynthesis